MEKNIIPLINHMQEKCRGWKSYPLSWMSRIAVIKMVLLPKLIFVLLNVILDLSNMILNKIQGIVNKFIILYGVLINKLRLMRRFWSNN